MNHQIFEKINKYPGSVLFSELFHNASKVFLDNCSIKKITRNTRFVTAGENVDKVWFMLSGEVEAFEEYITGDVYVFTRYREPELFGEMEAIADIPIYSTSLIASADCVFICFPVPLYLQYLKNNGEILYIRTHSIIKNIFNEAKVNRANLMLNSIDRIKIYFAKQYRTNNTGGKCVLANTRQQIADETGFSLKTVNRIVKKLNEQNYINISGHKLIISEDQYKRILIDIEERVN